MDFLLAIGKFLLFSLLSELIRPKTKVSRPAAGGLKDLTFPTSDPNRPHQWLIGRDLVDNGNLFGTWDFSAKERSRKVRTGMVSKQTIPLAPEYYVSFAMVLCGGSGVRLKKLMAGDRVLWTGDIGDGQTIDVNLTYYDEGQEDYPRGIKARIEFYSGSSVPSAYLNSKMAGKAPNWRHLTYVVVRGLPQTYNQSWAQLGITQELFNTNTAATAGNFSELFTSYPALTYTDSPQGGAWIGTSKQVEHLKFEIERMPSGASTGLGSVSGGGKVGDDANPAYAIAEIMTNQVYGAALDPAELDASSFHAAASRLASEGHGTSQLWDNQRASGEVVLELCRQIGGILVPNPETGLHELRLLRASDAVVLDLNEDTYEEVSSFSRNSMSEATNTLSLSYRARAEDYKERPIEVQDLAAIESAGHVIAGQTSYAGIMNAQIAHSVGIRDLRALSAPLASARVKAIVPKRTRLRPGDVVSFTSAAHGVTALRVRVTSARYAEAGQASCEVELIEDVFTSGTAVYNEPAPTSAPGSNVPVPLINQAILTVFAPYALSNDLADHALVAAAPGDPYTTSLRVGFKNELTSTTEYSPEVVGLSGYGLLAAPLPDVTASFMQLSISTATAAVLRRQAASCYVCVLPGTGSTRNDLEWMQVNAFSVAANGTSVNVTGIQRGLFGTIPYAWPAGSKVFILCDYAIDPAPLQSEIHGDGGLYLSLPGLNSSYLLGVSAGRNVRGLGPEAQKQLAQGPESGGVLNGNPSGTKYVCAMAPMAPGNVKLDGAMGSSSPDSAPSIIALTAGQLTAKWSPRLRGEIGTQPWTTAGTTGDADVSHMVSLQRLSPDGTYWQSLESTTKAPGTNEAVLYVGSYKGLLRLSITPTLNAGMGGYGRAQTWYFNLV